MTTAAAVLIATASLLPTAIPAQALTVEGTQIRGHLTGEAPGRLRFRGPEADWPLSRLRRVDFAPRLVDAADSRPLRRFRLTTGETISGTLAEWTPERLALTVRGGGRIELPSAAVAGIETPEHQREILYESFDGNTAERTGPRHATVTGPPPVAYHAAALNLNRSVGPLPYAVDRIGSGRVSLAFFEPCEAARLLRSSRAAGNEAWGVEFVFQPQGGGEAVRVRFRPTSTGYDVESPASAGWTTQPLRRVRGWRRLTFTFDPRRAVLLVDDDVLAAGRGIRGELIEILLWHEPAAPESGATVADRTDGPCVWIDDLLVCRRTDSDAARPAMTPLAGQDGLMLATGDRLYGRVTHIDAHHIRFEAPFGTCVLPAGDVTAVAFAARPPAMPEIAGFLCRIEFQPLLRASTAPCDRLIVALQSADQAECVADHPSLGRLHIPLAHVRRIEPLYLGRRQLLLAATAHLGDEVRGAFASPIPLGTQLEGRFSLDEVPQGRVFLRATVSHLEPAGPSAPPATPRLAELRSGALVTALSINGHSAGALNAQLTYRDTPGGPQEIRVPLPAGWLRAGENVWRVRQQPARDDPREFDDCELGPLALEIETGRD